MDSPVRKIIHVDMDAFYASVEQRDDPALRGKPVVVGGDPKGRGVVAAASYEARKFGIHSAMSTAKAHRLCPHAVFVFPQFSKYKEASRKIHAIFEEVSDRIEPLSLDEAFLDVTQNKLGLATAREVAVWIKQRIKSETGLTASAGVGPNKFVAKLASDLRKPDGLVVIPPEKVAALLERLPVEKLWGVGPATAQRLRERAIHTTADLRSVTADEIQGLLGSFGLFLQGLARGVDDRPVENEGDPKSRGAETTFDRDIHDPDRLKTEIAELARDVAGSLRRMECLARSVTVKVRYSDFRTVTRSRTQPQPIDDPSRIEKIAVDLLFKGTDAGARPVRLLGVTVSGLVWASEPQQLWFEF